MRNNQSRNETEPKIQNEKLPFEKVSQGSRKISNYVRNETL